MTLPSWLRQSATQVEVPGLIVLVLTHSVVDELPDAALLGELQPAEHPSVLRFRRSVDIRAAALRRILARSAAKELGAREDLTVTRSECARCGAAHGAPIFSGSDLKLSMSGTRTTSAIAVARVPVGIDIEEPLSEDSASALAKILGQEHPPQLAVERWTALEAQAKLLGTGIADLLGMGHQDHKVRTFRHGNHTGAVALHTL